jgi:hypothetical protein
MAVIGFLVVMLAVVFYVFPPWEVATDAPDKAKHAGMAQVPVAIWWAGSGALALALLCGIFRTRHRLPQEKFDSEQGTKQLYEEEDRIEKRDRETSL